MKINNKKHLLYGVLALGILASSGAYLYAKEKNEEKEIVRYIDPFEYFDIMNEKLLNDSFFNESMERSSFKIDVKEEEKQYIVEAELSGMKKENIQVNYENEYLIISTKSSVNNEEKKENYIKKERNFSEQSRSIYIPNVKETEIKAKFENGLLTIIMPKGEKIRKDKGIKID